ncbi:hypothetical protein DSL64_01685 [Dyadobacter luteus]|jgi:hypothetical protein|uniref:Uncharacterized protein n=1 Tax=Dyadobacter luteus TaxID=2259619 RepID=A0A3D8YHY1_9BACT|nr:hypothetical protein DSL64_01685 [Dyadobacter luteus]
MVNPYIEAKLYKRQGDLSKRWYVEFGAWNPSENSVEKKKIYCPAKFKTEKQREVNATVPYYSKSTNSLRFIIVLFKS